MTRTAKFRIAAERLSRGGTVEPQIRRMLDVLPVANLDDVVVVWVRPPESIIAVLVARLWERFGG